MPIGGKKPVKRCGDCKQVLRARTIRSFSAPDLGGGPRIMIFRKSLPLLLCPTCDAPSEKRPDVIE